MNHPFHDVKPLVGDAVQKVVNLLIFGEVSETGEQLGHLGNVFATIPVFVKLEGVQLLPYMLVYGSCSFWPLVPS